MRHPDITGTPAETAAEYRLQVHRDYGHARSEARRADRFYQTAASCRHRAAWLTRHPDLWTPEYTPAGLEEEARTWERLADLYLRGYFSAVASARFHAGLARDYDTMAARDRESREALARELADAGVPECGTPMTHRDESVGHCTLPRDHFVQIEDSPHYDEHGCTARVLVRQATIREVAHVSAQWPDGIHTCQELQRLEPGRRACTCGRCPS
jgi:hypothetical protein